MLQVFQFKCLKDNYGFLIKDLATDKVICVDTPDANAIITFAHQNNLVISEVWNTHWHPDHAGGNAAIKAEFGAILKGPQEVLNNNFPLDEVLSAGSVINFGDKKVQILDLSGHTGGHIGYYFADDEMVFVGDALFVLGCGRLFEGDAKMAWAGLTRLKALPPATKVYCAHEYSLANAEFCASLNLSNAALKARIAEITNLTQNAIPTVPTTIAAELSSNPFLLADKENLIRELALEGKADYEIFGHIRELKNKF